MPIQIKKVCWDIPDNIGSCYTTRIGGYSKGSYGHANLSYDVGDTRTTVKKNRAELKKNLGLDHEPAWMKQIHSSYVRKVTESNKDLVCDACYTSTPGLACAVLSADCLPILICNSAGTKVGVIHSGWRGLSSGIITKFITRFSKDPQDIICWIGPSISAGNYPVREDVYKKLIKISPKIFAKYGNDRWKSPDRIWKLDMKLAAKIILKAQGVSKIFTDDMCTYQNSNLYYSYRGENNTGRIASLIWIK